MYAAACASMTALRARRLASAAISARSTAAVESRSSQSAMGRAVNCARFRAKARVDCARGPSVPSMLIGNPSTIPVARRSAASARIRFASRLNRVRAIVSTGAAIRRSGSLTETPTVLLPRSRPSSAPSSGKTPAASLSMTTSMAPPLAWAWRDRHAALQTAIVSAMSHCVGG